MKNKVYAPVFSLLLGVATLTGFSLGQIRADTIGLSFTGGTQSQLHNLTIGWTFSLSAPVSFTELGLWDGPGPGTGGTAGDGFGVAHDVTIWTSGGTSLFTANVPAGTTATLTDGFRYVPITPTLLAPGTYVISAYYAQSSFDTSISNASSITTAPGVTYIAGKSASGNVFPAGDVIGAGGIKSYFGPNFQFASAVPETASTLPLLFLSIGILLAAQQLGRRQTKKSYLRIPEVSFIPYAMRTAPCSDA